MIIRPATLQDVEAVSDLWLKLIKYHQDLSDLMPQMAADGKERYAARIRWSVEDDYIQTYVAQEDDVLIGYVYGTIIDLLPEMFISEKAGVIGDIYVDRAYRGKGVGKSLMGAMKDWFRSRDVQYYEWYVAAMNEQGLHFWRDTMGGKTMMVRMRALVD